MKRIAIAIALAGIMILPPIVSAESTDVNLGWIAAGVGTDGGGAGTYEANCDPVLATSCSAAAGLGWGGCQTAKGTIIIAGLPDPDVKAELCITMVVTASAGAVWHLNPLTNLTRDAPQLGGKVDLVGGVPWMGQGTARPKDAACVVQTCSAVDSLSAESGASRVKAEASATVYSEVPADKWECADATAEAWESGDTWGERAAAVQEAYENDPRCQSSIEEVTVVDAVTCSEDTFRLVVSCGATASAHDDANVCGEGTAEVTSIPSVGETTEATGSGKTAACGDAMLAFLQGQQSSSLEEATPESRRQLAEHLDSALLSGLADIDEQGTAFCAQMEEAEEICMETHQRLLDDLAGEIAYQVAAVAG